MATVPISPQTITLLLAYVHHYTCKHLPGRYFSATDLRKMAAWVGQPEPSLTSIRQHPALAMHLLLAVEVGLLDTESGVWVCTPFAFPWLEDPVTAQIQQLSEPIQNQPSWEQAVSTWGFKSVLPIDYTAFVQQSLARQLENLPQTGMAQWFPGSVAEEWFLRLPMNVPAKLLFHLIQFGEWHPDETLHCTQLTLMGAMLRSYSPRTMAVYMAEATGEPFPEQARHQLDAWYDSLADYTLEEGVLLSTAQPHYLADILAQKRLRQRVIRQLSPRHALVSAALVAPLGRWLGKQSRHLRDLTTVRTTEPDKPLTEMNAAHIWLALRVYRGLSAWLPLPTSIPHASLAAAERHLQTHEKTLLEHQALIVLDGIRQAIRGRDAFFASETLPEEVLLHMLKEVVYHEIPVDILYRGLVDREARWRRVEPLRLETRGALTYLHAYCQLAEANRVFWADRIKAWEVVEVDGGTPFSGR